MAKQQGIRRLWIGAILLLFIYLGSVVAEEEIKWTPNDDAENPPLPLAMKQRQQLLQLQEAIQTSPDPEGTLRQVAEAQGMSPQDLVNMMDKNSRDLQQNPSLAQPTTIVTALTKVGASLGLLLSQSARKHPQSFAVTLATVIFLLYASITIPRTGMHVSRRTTLFSPHQRYMQKLADSPRLESARLSVLANKIKWDDLKLEEDGVHIHKLPRKSELVQAVSARLAISPDGLLEEFETANDDESFAEERQEVIDLIYESAAELVSSRSLTEFSTDQHPLRGIASSDRQKHGVLLVYGLGLFGRHGIVSWRSTHQLETDKDASVTLTTLKGMAMFDGQIHCQVQKYRSKVVVTAHLVVPKRGRRISKAMAKKIVNELVNSLGASASRRAEQTLARQRQGRKFKSAGHRRATERRQSRFEKEKLMEEMSEDRRRKWQRNNPGGRYRPSGDRQKSPNNC